MRKYLILALILTLSFTAKSQYPWNTFQKIIDDDFTCYESQGGVAMASDRGYIVSGYRRNCTVGGWSAFLMKTDFAGNIQFAKDLSAAQAVQFIDAVASTDKSIVAVGLCVQPAGDYDILVVKFDSCGTVKWQKRYGNAFADMANHIIRTSDGNYAIAGWTATGNAATDRNMLLIKVQDSDGALLGSYSYGAAGTAEFAIDVIQTSEGGFALIGTQRTSFPFVSVLKLTNTGTVSWSKSYNLRVSNGDGTFYNGGTGKKVIQTSDNNLVVFISGTGPFAEGGSRSGLMKINIANGNALWSKNYKIDINPNQQTGTYGGCQTSDGGFALIGYTAKRTQSINLMELYIMKTDADGNVSWANSYGKTNRQHLQSGYTQEYGGKLVMTPDSGFVFSATMTHAGLTNPENLWLVKTDKSGRAPDCNINTIHILTDISTPTTSAGLALNAYTPSSSATACTLTTPVISNFNAVCNGIIYTPTDSVISSGIYGPVDVCPGLFTYMVPPMGSGYTYTWSVTGGGSIQSGNGTPAIKVNITGNATINITIKGSCNYITTLSLNVNMGGGLNSFDVSGGGAYCAGANVTLNISGSGTGTMSYQWMKNGTNLNGATNSIYNITGLNFSDAGNYSIIVTNICGKVTSNSATISVYSEPVITYITPDKTVCSGDTASIKVIATGSSLKYQWSRNSIPISGATGSNLPFIPITLSNAGNYSCIVSNDCKSSSASTSLTVNDKVLFLDTIPNQTKCQGENITFSFNSTGTNPSYQWTKGAGGSNITGATNSSYTLSNLKPFDYDVYSCKVSNDCGTKVLPKFLLTVVSPPTSNIKFVKQIKYLGENASYFLSPGGTGPFTFQWKKSGISINGETNSILNINSVECGDSGIYSCYIANSCRNITAKIVELYVLGCYRYKFAISGYVKYENKDSFAMSSLTNNTITNISLYNTGDSLIEKTETDDNGLYVFEGIVNGNYKLIASTSKRWSGSNPADALLVNRDYIGVKKIIGPPSLKRLSADVNNDLKIDPKDALIINRRYIGVIDKFVDKNKITLPDWIFSNPEITIETGDIKKNILAICSGDVNGSYSNIPARLMYTPVNTAGSLNVIKGKEFDLPVYLNDITTLGAIGFKFKINSSGFRIINLKSNIDGIIFKIINNDQQSTNNEQLINIAWSANVEGYNISPDKPLFFLTCITNAQYPINDNQYSIFISSESIISDLDANSINTDKIVIPKLIFSNQQSAISFLTYPNPFSNITNIEYSLPETCFVSIKVYNLLGMQIAEIVDAHQDAGIFRTAFNASDLPSGSYFFRLLAQGTNRSFSQTKFMILSR